MRLLVVTQAVDRRDPILGFFHRWLQMLAPQCDRLIVIGQRVGDKDLPGNVRVESLGKEEGSPTIGQVLHFWRIILLNAGGYEAVLVHMTPIWIVLGAPVWILLRKRMYLWYEARGVRWPLRVALKLVRKVFSASEFGMPIKTRRSIITGHGIDVEVFRPSGQEPEKGLLVTVGRVTKAKRLDILLQALRQLPPYCRLTIVGKAMTLQDKALEIELQEFIHNNGLNNRVTIGPLPPEETQRLLDRAQIFLHSSETSLDKALLEAMAYGIPVVSCAVAAQDVLPDACRSTPETFAAVTAKLLEMPPAERQALSSDLRMRVAHGHALGELVRRLCDEMRS